MGASERQWALDPLTLCMLLLMLLSMIASSFPVQQLQTSERFPCPDGILIEVSNFSFGLDQDARRKASLLKVAFQEGILLQQVTSTPERHLD